MKLSLILGLFLLISQASADQVYRCDTGSGKAIFSQFPCGDDASVIEVNPQPSGVSTEEAIKSRQENLEALEASSKRLKRRNLEARIDNLVGKRNALSGKRNKKITKLQKDLREAYDFREKAVIESKMREVRHQYRVDRRRLNQKIYDTRAELSLCCD
ncbi:MAG: DUF4124 domain-containing protein [Candidatus Thiodiazotropha sp.]